MSQADRSVASFLLFVILALAVVTACSDSTTETDSEAASDESSSSNTADTSDTTAATASPTTVAEVTTENDPVGDESAEDDGAGDEAAVGEADFELQPLLERIAATVERTSASYSLDVAQTLPVPPPNQARLLRTGSFDDERSVGTGTQLFLGSAVNVEGLTDDPENEFEFRLVDDTYWLLNPLSNPPTWTGYAVDDFVDFAGGDPTLSMNGDLFLLVVGASITEVTDVVDFGDGSQGWTVKVLADELLPLVVTNGVRQRLEAAGLQPTDVEATALVAVDPDGMVVGFLADLQQWWQEVVGQSDNADGGSTTMAVQFELGDFDAAVDVSSPCTEAEEYNEPGLPDALVCDG